MYPVYHSTTRYLMKVQLIRNATLKLEYHGKTILVDPMLGEKGAYDPFVGGPRNPTVELPVSAAEVLDGTEMVLITHCHPDHLDPPAVAGLDKSLPIFFQPFDRETITGMGFENATAIEESIEWEGISIYRTGGKHGTGEILNMLGEVSGFVLKAPGEPSLYLVGDSILEDNVRAALAAHAPDVIVCNAGGAQIPGAGLILMEESETIAVHELAPEAAIVAVHLESLDHCQVTRESLRAAIAESGHQESAFHIPWDGEILEF